MDACFAGNVRAVIQRRGDKAWEYIGACGQDEIIGVGITSFSSAVAASLDKLYQDYGTTGFTTQLLVTEVERFTHNRHRKLREQKKKKGPVILPCFYRRHKPESDEYESLSSCCESAEDDFICLVPLDQKSYFSDDPIAAHLRLKIELKDESLTDDQLRQLCEAICRAVKETETVRTQRVELMRLTLAPRLMLQRSITKLINVTRFAVSPTRKKLLDPISEPGFFATFGFMDMRSRLHFQTFTIFKPEIMALAAGMAVVFLGWRSGWRSIKQ
jgi:hypothetical protein